MPTPGAPSPAAGPASGLPIGLAVAGAARQLSRTFDAALADHGGSPSAWLVLLTLRSRPVANQRELAAAIGVQGATLTHHLNAMESAGLLTRRRDPANRRVHLVELTPAGEATFHRLRGVVAGYDERLRAGFSDDELTQLRALLGRLERNALAEPVGDSADGSALTRQNRSA